eukprot:CAMPEP_0178748556 /NCGR_PEP_ID=MMETSP0744-20121128/8944_2 /TAXON_ID=913974 /ORGANISM="Nitzschia punctata, Strain CCMP561" /LENGTH=358 /DNA_ID=CAMNT_0020401919 /DNA_START=45 /DNA_END=1121 /DNA_ORIENTATION=-
MSPPEPASIQGESNKLPPENARTMTKSDSSSGPLAVANILISIWSKISQRESPSESKTAHVRLITIAASHYCEKVRWVLDVLERDETSPYYYTEDAHPPGFHSWEPLEASKGAASITPMVIFNDESNGNIESNTGPTALWESSKIVETFLPTLYPSEIADEVRDMEADLGRRLGPAVRCVAYYYLFQDLEKYEKAAMDIAADPRKMSNIESTLWGKFLPKGLANGICKSLKINEDTKRASVQEIRAVIKEISEKLGTQEYLMDQEGGRTSFGFTAADLSLASLAYPLVRPPEMEYWLANSEEVPPELNALTEEIRASRAGQHVLKMYKEHRPVDEQHGVVVMKYSNRNRSFFQWMFGY